jgi:ubiquinone/menaquinone biosynthesis C-methylase UbiE
VDQRSLGMTPVLPFVFVIASVLVPVAACQEPDAKQVAQERKEAELDAPKLAEVLGLRPGMAVADVGAGFGAMTVVLAKSLESGRVFATDIGKRQLTVIQEYVQREGLTNVTVIEGASDSANLPAACCDAVFLRHVYHHVGAVEAFNNSLNAALKPGGRLAIIDFVPKAGSKQQPGVPANRGGHGIPIDVLIDEIKATGLNHVRTIEKWPPGEKAPGFLVLFEKP